MPNNFIDRVPITSARSTLIKSVYKEKLAVNLMCRQVKEGAGGYIHRLLLNCLLSKKVCLPSARFS